MSSDKARITYDEKQQYRSVVMQQGRVSLEADWNEQGWIVAEEIRKEALDFVGPSGTPDDGYAVSKGSKSGPYDLSIKPGTLYVGGLRVNLDPQSDTTSLSYSNQPDWLDHDPVFGPEHIDGDPYWVDLPKDKPNSNEYVYLLLREQEVSAVEDSALLEVALGGPDTTARTRLIQRIIRTSTGQVDCPSALEDLTKEHWKQQGLVFDPLTMRLKSMAKLTVNFDTSTMTSDPFYSQSTGGYLGAENQLIRVMIIHVDSFDMKHKLIWGYDNASFLYRVKEVINNQNLVLATQPVDSFHQPTKDQAIEILRAAVKLPNGEYVAADHGFVTQLSANYDPDQQSVKLNKALPDGYPQDNNLNAPIYLRVWQEEITFEPGKSIPLGGTGLNISLETDENGFHIGDFWTFSVRPGTPDQVYPSRYKTPQLPDGPRLWACPLALVDWKCESGTGVTDCRNHFENLVELAKRKLCDCCPVTTKPDCSCCMITDRYCSFSSYVIIALLLLIAILLMANLNR